MKLLMAFIILSASQIAAAARPGVGSFALFAVTNTLFKQSEDGKTAVVERDSYFTKLTVEALDQNTQIYKIKYDYYDANMVKTHESETFGTEEQLYYTYHIVFPDRAAKIIASCVDYGGIMQDVEIKGQKMSTCKWTVTKEDYVNAYYLNLESPVSFVFEDSWGTFLIDGKKVDYVASGHMVEWNYIKE